MSDNLQKHWDNVYLNNDNEQLGWYEATAKPSLDLIAKCQLEPNARQLHVGAGTTFLIDELLEQGYSRLIVSDLSSSAIAALSTRLGPKAKSVQFVADDLCSPMKLNQLQAVDLWHDRAVLHFFNTDEEQKAYFDLLRLLVKPKAYVIIAVFNLQGAKLCSGLPVFRYNEEMLQDRLGPGFTLIEAFDHSYIQPSGNTREFVYTLFQRTN